jgi:transcriptional regulator with XRE-family HTH domain
MIEISLGQRIHELRDKADLSLRGLAKRIGISSAFLSDIELGRRFPSEEILAKLAGALAVSPDELKQYDTRAPIADLKRLMDSDPKLGFAFRTVVEKVKNGELTAEDIIVKLEQQTELRPTQIMTDTGAYSDVVFGLFRLLGYRFCPRLADIGGTRFWRIPQADYGKLNVVSRHRLKLQRIARHWDDMQGWAEAS